MFFPSRTHYHFSDFFPSIVGANAFIFKDATPEELHNAGRMIQEIQEDEKEHNGVETFSSRYIGPFLKEKKIVTPEQFEEHFSSQRLYQYLLFKGDTITPSEQKLLEYYQGNMVNGVLPDMGNIPPTASQDLIDLKLIELGGKGEFTQYFQGKEWHKNQRDRILDSGKTVPDQVSDFYKNAKRNIGKLPLGEKAFLLVAGVFLSTAIYKSENATIKGLRSILWGTCKTLLYGFGINLGIKAVTGKSGWQHLEKFTSKHSEHLNTLSQKFSCSTDEAELLRESIILDTMSYTQAMNWYPKALSAYQSDFTRAGETNMEKAKRMNEKLRRIIPQQGSMASWQVFIALHTFFEHYGREKIQEKYKKTPSIKWPDILVQEMTDDPDPFFINILTDEVKGLQEDAENKNLYEKGKDTVKSAFSLDPEFSNLSDFYQEAFSEDPDHLGNFKNEFDVAKTAGIFNATTQIFDNLPYAETSVAGYYISRMKVTHATDGSVNYYEENQKLEKQAQDFLQQKNYSSKYIEPVYRCQDGEYLSLFVRCPKNGTLEFNNREQGKWKGGNANEMKNKELLEEGDTISVLNILKWSIILKFGLSDAEFDKFIEHLVKTYSGMGLETEEVLKKLEDELKNAGLRVDPQRLAVIQQNKLKFDAIEHFVVTTLQRYRFNSHQVQSQIIGAPYYQEMRLRCEAEEFQLPPVNSGAKVREYKIDMVREILNQLNIMGIPHPETEAGLLAACPG